MPTNCQTEMRARVTSALDSRPSHGANREPNPTTFKAPAATPQSGDRIKFQENPTMTTESIVGRNMTVRYRPFNFRPGRLSNPASAMPIGFCTHMCTAKKIRLLPKAFQNGFDHSELPSWTSKLASPTKWRAPDGSLV